MVNINKKHIYTGINTVKSTVITKKNTIIIFFVCGEGACKASYLYTTWYVTDFIIPFISFLSVSECSGQCWCWNELSSLFKVLAGVVVQLSSSLPKLVVRPCSDATTLLLPWRRIIGRSHMNSLYIVTGRVIVVWTVPNLLLRNYFVYFYKIKTYHH